MLPSIATVSSAGVRAAASSGSKLINGGKSAASREPIVRALLGQKRQGGIKSLSSSASIVDYLQDSMKDKVNEAVKSTVLAEMSKPNSDLWNSEKDDRVRPTAGRVNGNRTDGNLDNVNDPIDLDRVFMLNDPLEEWFLDATPSRKLSNVSPSILACDPFLLSKADMKTLSESIRQDLIASQHPVLTKAAAYFFEADMEKNAGKKVRPMMIMLVTRALNAAAAQSNQNINNTVVMTGADSPQPKLGKAQRRLAEISEMIHTASLFHDDVIDDADTRRGVPAVHKVFGNKMAILAGDYLLARSSIYLARLRNVEVYESMSLIIEHLVRGEVMQINKAFKDESPMVYYLRKNFYKTASLMANSCKSAAILGNHNDELVTAAYQYGKHLGIAFQLVDDVLDFDGSASTMGKPALSDLNAGLSTAPILFASEVYPTELKPLMDRKFSQSADVDLALEYVRKTDCIQQTKDLAWIHADLAIQAIEQVPQSPYRDSLIHLAYKVIQRTH